MDASSLLMPMVRFVSPTDRRWLSSLRVIEKDLVEDSLVYRYKDDDGLGGAEGTFTMCSFWYVENSGAQRRSAQGALSFREDARLREPPRTVRGGTRTERRTPG